MERSLKSFLDKLNKNGNLILPSDKPICAGGKKLPRISFGNMLLDVASCGGIPQGKIIRVFGALSGGKTQLAYRIFRVNQNRCHYCWEDAGDCGCEKYSRFRMAYVSLENSWDPNWAAKNGIEVNKDPDQPNVLVSEPETGEQAVDIVDAIIRGRHASLIIVDSLAAMLPTIELEKGTQDFVGGQVGAHAKMINAAMRKWVNGLVPREDDKAPPPIVICINQIRETTDQYNPETTPGGRGQGFASSFDLRIERKKYRTDKGVLKGLNEKSEQKGIPVAQLIQFHVPKSKIGPSGRTGEFFMWQSKDSATNMDVGDVSYGPSLLEYAQRYGVIKKISGHYTIVSSGKELGKSMDSVKLVLSDNRDLYDQVTEEIRVAASEEA